MGKPVNSLTVIAETGECDAWLAYTLDLAGRLMGLTGPVAIVSPENFTEAGPCLFYGVTPPDPSLPFVAKAPRYRQGEMTMVALDCGLDQDIDILVYSDSLCEGSNADLIFNLFAYASCLEEYDHERQAGPIHSYASRLKGDGRRFDRPYGNFLALALRQMIDTAFPGELPPRVSRPAIYLTHDIDVVDKVVRVRLKEGGFRAFNAARNLLAGQWRRAGSQARGALRMFFGRQDYFLLDAIANLEREFDVRSAFNVYAGTRPRGLAARLRDIIFNPHYKLAGHVRLGETLTRLASQGWDVGAHFAFDTWREAGKMQKEREHIEKTLGGTAILSSRQHWFRFSMADTWRSLWQSGIRIDTTLGFTDRPGYRAGLAIAYQPYDHETRTAHPITVIPSALMDTHLFYYGNSGAGEDGNVINDLLEDIKYVGGEACIIWHTHVFSSDHNWAETYRNMLFLMRAGNIRSGRVSEIPAGHG